MSSKKHYPGSTQGNRRESLKALKLKKVIEKIHYKKSPYIHLSFASKKKKKMFHGTKVFSLIDWMND